MRLPVSLVAVVVLAVAAPAPSAAHAKRLTVVQANVGNINGACAAQKFKLCQPAVQARAAKALRALRPDVVGFEEILPRTHQPRKLLGSGYRVQCDSRFGWDCLAVRKASGVKIARRLRTRPVLHVCDDRGFTLNRATLRYRGRSIALAVAHPDSDSTDAGCRAAQLEDLFGSFSRRGRVLALGDWNLDPYREHDAGVDAFDAARKRLHLHLASGRTVSLRPGTSMGDATGTKLDDGTTPFPPPFSDRTLDHVLTRGLSGRCVVRRIDGGGGMDHRAQVCKLKVSR